MADQCFRGFLLVIGPVLADSWGLLVGQCLLVDVMTLRDWTTWMVTSSKSGQSEIALRSARGRPLIPTGATTYTPAGAEPV